MRIALGVIVALLSTATGPALAQTAEQVPPAEFVAPPPPTPQTIRIPAGTVVQVELTEALSSRTSQQEQLFGLRLAEPIVIDGSEVVPAGAIGGGEVIDAHASAFGGRQGRLIISGRFIEINGHRARIRGMQITAAGEDRANTALAVSMIPYAGVAGIFIQGGEVSIPAGARGTARLAEDIDVPLSASDTAPVNSDTLSLSLSSPVETPAPTVSGENQQ
ncbi:MAG: hypothetical protein A4S17_13230 [Proteobacteria bacterium HN_bin10]|nr:MAG: hypothetical protein A4S17_13230 [Proteobacteria bacterium HN_bin10]